MQKFQKDMRIVANEPIGERYTLMSLTPNDESRLPIINPGQFVNVECRESKSTFLRRPISICDVDYEKNQLRLLIRKAGAGTESLCRLRCGQTVNIIFPLGSGFPEELLPERNVLLIGGGVGVAPLLYYGRRLGFRDIECRYVLGARSKDDLLLLEEFEKIAPVEVATEDGSKGTRGFVTDCPSLNDYKYDIWAVCGPMPMMKAVARIARSRDIECYVSLENKMACGLGACLCCVEKTVDGNQCTCTSGPVFNAATLLWD